MPDLIKLASLELQATLLADMWEEKLAAEAALDKPPEELPTGQNIKKLPTKAPDVDEPPPLPPPRELG